MRVLGWLLHCKWWVIMGGKFLSTFQGSFMKTHGLQPLAAGFPGLLSSHSGKYSHSYLQLVLLHLPLSEQRQVAASHPGSGSVWLRLLGSRGHQWNWAETNAAAFNNGFLIDSSLGLLQWFLLIFFYKHMICFPVVSKTLWSNYDAVWQMERFCAWQLWKNEAWGRVLC